MNEIRRELWLALGAGLILRIVYFFWSLELPFFDHPITDALFHHRWAEAIANGVWWNGQPFFKAPLYPYTLGLIYSLFGSSVWVGKVFGHLIGVATGGLIVGLAHQIGGKRVAVMASVLWLGSGLLLFFEGELLLDSYFTFLSLASVFLLLTSKPSGYRLALAGLMLGLAAITRPTILVCIPAYAGWLYVQRSHFTRSNYTVFGLATALPILLVAGINTWALGRPAGIAMQGGINFYIGNNEQASGTSAQLPEPWGYAWSYRQLTDHAETMTGRDLDAVEVSDFYYSQGTDFLMEHPADAARLFAKKGLLSLNRVTISNNLNLNYVTIQIPLLKWLPVRVWWLIPLALVGLLMRPPTYAKQRMLWQFAMLYATTLVLFFVAERFRLPIVPVLIVLAASGISTFWEVRRSRLPAALAVLLCGVLITAPNWYDIRPDHDGMAYFNLGNVALRTGQNARAVLWYDSALAASPDMQQLRLNRGLAHLRLGSVDLASADYAAEAGRFTFDARPHNNLAALHLLRGDTVSAQAAIDSGLARDSTLGLLYRQRLSIAEAQTDTHSLRVTLNQAMRLAGQWPVWIYWQGELERIRMKTSAARIAYLRFESRTTWPTLDGEDLLYAGPGASRTAYSIGLTYLQEGRIDSAAIHFGEAAMSDSTFGEAWSNWGTAALSVGSILTAQSRYRQAIRANPASPVYWTNLAWAHIQGSQNDSARTALVSALALDSAFGPAISLARQLENSEN